MASPEKIKYPKTSPFFCQHKDPCNSLINKQNKFSRPILFLHPGLKNKIMVKPPYPRLSGVAPAGRSSAPYREPIQKLGLAERPNLRVSREILLRDLTKSSTESSGPKPIMKVGSEESQAYFRVKNFLWTSYSSLPAENLWGKIKNGYY
jgi:hypothetical protein